MFQRSLENSLDPENNKSWIRLTESSYLERFRKIRDSWIFVISLGVRLFNDPRDEIFMRISGVRK